MALGPEVSCHEEPGDTAALSTSVFGFVGRRKVMFASEEGRVTNGPANTASMSGQRRGWDPGPLFFSFPCLPLTPCGSIVTGALPSLGFFNHKGCKWVTLSVGNCVSSGNKHRLCDPTVWSHVLTGGLQGSHSFTESVFPNSKGKQLYLPHGVELAMVTLKPLC